MKNLFAERTAIYCLVIILSLVIIFHVLVLMGVIPFQIVWGGRLTNIGQMLRFETVSIAVNLLMLAVVGSRAGFLSIRIKPLIITIILWLMGGLFLLNTIGNLLSINAFEKMVFTPVTFVLALCCIRLAVSNGVEKAEKA